MMKNNVMIGAIGAMSLTKYTSKSTPTEDLRYARVKLLKSQVKASKYDSQGYRLVTVKKFPDFNFVQKKGDYALYTMDRKGNPDKTTVYLLDYNK
jgi:hypothetical protein